MTALSRARFIGGGDIGRRMACKSASFGEFNGTEFAIAKSPTRLDQIAYEATGAMTNLTQGIML